MFGTSRPAISALPRANASFAAGAAVASSSRLPQVVPQATRTARQFSTTCTWSAPAKGGRSDSRSKQPPREYRDEAIRARLVRLVDPATNALMPAVYPVKDLLNTIDRKRFWVVQVKPQTGPKKTTEPGRQAEEEEEDEEDDDDDRRPRRDPTPEEMAVVKLVDKKAVYDQQKAAKQKASAADDGATPIGAGVSGPGAVKELQFTWASMSNDMDHKLTHMKTQHLIRRGPGARLQVTITTPKNKGTLRPGQATTPEAKKAFCEGLQQKLCDWIMTAEGEQLPLNQAVQVVAANSAETVKPDTKGGYYARRRGEIDWRGGKRLPVAVFEVEVVKAR